MKKHETYQPARTSDPEMQEHLSKDLQLGCFALLITMVLVVKGLIWVLTQ